MKSLRITTIALFCSLILVGCSFLATNQEMMDHADKMAGAAQVEGLGYYEAYSKVRFDELWGSEKFVLFFHADWCPTCRALEAALKEDLSVLNGHVVLEVNYDTEEELKKEYGILVQSTVVFVDSNGSVFETRVNPRLELIENFFKI